MQLSALPLPLPVPLVWVLLLVLTRALLILLPVLTRALLILALALALELELLILPQLILPLLVRHPARVLAPAGSLHQAWGGQRGGQELVWRATGPRAQTEGDRRPRNQGPRQPLPPPRVHQQALRPWVGTPRAPSCLVLWTQPWQRHHRCCHRRCCHPVARMTKTLAHQWEALASGGA